ncbi:MAG TPA: hypothetical protein VFS43_15550 [Polyangiaceae bacterium]|nr:hypothetical protein [Polyangiaceae bacterium]
MTTTTVSIPDRIGGCKVGRAGPGSKRSSGSSTEACRSRAIRRW